MSEIKNHKGMEFFKSPDIVEHIEQSYWSEIEPLSLPTDDQNMIEYNFTTSERTFIDLGNLRLHIKFKLVKELPDKTIEALHKTDDIVFCANGILNALWRDIELYLNQELVSCKTSHYGYESYLDTLLHYDQTEKQGFLQQEGYIHPDSGVDLAQLSIKKSPFAAKLYSEINNNKTVSYMGRLRLNIASYAPYLLDNINVRICMFFNKKEFFLNSPNQLFTNYKLKFEKITLHVHKHKLKPSVYTALQSVISENNPAKYPLNNFQIKTYPLMKDQSNCIIQDIFNGYTPSHLIFCMIPSDSFQGVITKNSFAFGHFNIQQIGVFVDDQCVTNRPLDINIAQKDYSVIYQNLLDYTGHRNIGINYHDFILGRSIFIIPTLPENTTNLIKKGKLKVELFFQKALVENITLMFCGYFPNLVEIDQTRLVVV